MGVIGAALSPAIAISAQEKKATQMVPKRNTILIILPSSRTNRNMGRSAQMNRQQMET